MADRPMNGGSPEYPEFATEKDYPDPVSGEYNVQEPSVEVKLHGWRRLERPPRYWLNWLHRLTDLWIKWFDQEVERFRTILTVTFPGLINDLDGRLDTLETTVNTTVDGRLDTLETTVNTTVDGRLDDIEGGLATMNTRYPFNGAGSCNLAFSGLGSADVTANGCYILHNPYLIAGDPVRVDIYLTGINGTASGTVSTFQTAEGALPAQIRPSSNKSFPIVVLNNGYAVPGTLYINTIGRVSVWVYGTSSFVPDFELAGGKGFCTDIFISYIL